MDTAKKIKVSICIVTYNRVKDTLDCLNSVYTSQRDDFEVILFDNNSDQKIDQDVLSGHSNLQYIYNKENIGNAGGRNFCGKIAKGEYIMFLDSDTIIDKDTIGELANALDKDPKLGIVAPKMFFYDGGKTDIFIAGQGKFSKRTTLCSDVVLYKKDNGQFDNQVRIDYAQNGFMVRKNVSREIGGHDPKIFMTYLETDYFLRVQRLGYETVYIPAAKLWHKTNLIPKKTSLLRDELGLTDPERIYYNMRNRSVIVKRYYAWHAKIVYIFSLVHLFFLYYLYKFILYKAPREYFSNLLQGYFEGILIFLGIKKFNLIINKNDKLISGKV